MRFLKDQQAIETSEVAVIIAVVVLVAYGAYQLLGRADCRSRTRCRWQDLNSRRRGLSRSD